MENFKLEGRPVSITGYHFPTDNPSHVVCLIHGIGEHMGRYKRMAEHFNRSGIALVGMDLRGHGSSAGPRGGTAPRTEILSDIDALINKVESFYPNVPIVLYGHSMGGNIALDFRARGTLNYKPSAYIISAPWIKLCKNIPSALYTMVKLMAKVKPDFQISSTVDEKDLGHPDNVLPYHDDPLVHDRITMACAKDGYEIGNSIFDGPYVGNGLGAEKPTLLMHGDIDKICSVEGSRALKQHEPSIQYIEWKNLCHEIHNGGPDSLGDEVIQKAIEFIKQQ